MKSTQSADIWIKASDFAVSVYAETAGYVNTAKGEKMRQEAADFLKKIVRKILKKEGTNVS